MEIWLASAKVSEITAHEWVPISGLITNPSVLLAAGSDWRRTIEGIAQLSVVGGADVSNVHLQAIARDRESIVREMLEFAELLSPKHLVCKIPFGLGGLCAIPALAEMGFRTNVTALCTLGQLQLAERAGADYLSVYVARINDNAGGDAAGFRLVDDARSYLERVNSRAKIMAASIRSVDHYDEVIRRGAHSVAASPELLDAVRFNDLTESSLRDFAKKWHSTAK